MKTLGEGGRPRAAAADGGMGQLQLEHCLRVLLHRKWRVLGVWLLVSLATVIVSYRMRDVYTSETLILVDPQKVPEAYVKATVTGDIRNRLSTLKTQILSATRLQTIIDTLKLYPEEREQKLAREDIITKMQSDITVRVESGFGSGQDLQAFRIGYSGTDPQLVAQVTSQLAELFINENLKARAAQATGTTDFLTNQLEETRKRLEEQEAKLRDFKMKHVGEMPAQEAADIQLLGQAQAQLQIEAEALSRTEQQRGYIQSMMSQSSPVVDLDEGEQRGPNAAGEKGSAAKPSVLAQGRAELAQLLSRYGEQHPDVKRLKSHIEDLEAKEAKAEKEAPRAVAADPAPTDPPPVKPAPRPPVKHFNPVLQAELKTLDAEMAKHKQEQQRLSNLVTTYRAKLDAIPLREQEIAAVERDYQMSKAHYSHLLEQQLSAQTATQLEQRQKGENFEVLDRAQPAEKPSRPNRPLINGAGCLGGLILGSLLALGKELFGVSIGAAQDITASGIAVLGVIPVIQTRADQRRRTRQMALGTMFALVAALAGCVIIFYHYHPI
jgi:succinoglycan biosynthesis transport protein ExoP